MVTMRKMLIYGRRYTKLFCRVSFYLLFATLCNFRSIWNWSYEPVGFRCNGPAKPVNNTGLKVLVYALAKTGTTSMGRELRKFYPTTWHSEEIYFHLFAPVTDEYWSRTENGGGMFPWQRLSTPAPPAYNGHSFWDRSDHGADRIVWENTPISVWAEKISKCGVEAILFDGVEGMFWPIYEASPGAKVIMLNWRKWEAYEKSRRKFGIWMFVALLSANFVNCGQHMLPWNTFAQPFLDILTNNSMLHFMERGDPLLSMVTIQMLAFRISITERRLMNRLASGMTKYVHIGNKEEYNAHWLEGKKRIPKESLLEFDLTKNTLMDLCKFLGIEDNPACNTEPIPKSGECLMTHEYEAPHHFVILMPWFLFIHYVNYTLFYGTLRWLGDKLLKLLALCSISKAKKVGAKKKKAA